MEDDDHDAAAEAARERALGDDLHALLESGLALAKAEVDLQQARAGYAVGKIRSIAILGVAAFVLVCFALIALTVGLVIALTPLLGALCATFAVFGGLVLVAFACALVAKSLWTRMIRELSNRSEG
jgi:putative Mn2+ efflux pump MntP